MVDEKVEVRGSVTNLRPEGPQIVNEPQAIGVRVEDTANICELLLHGVVGGAQVLVLFGLRKQSRIDDDARNVGQGIAQALGLADAGTEEDIGAPHEVATTDGQVGHDRCVTQHDRASNVNVEGHQIRLKVHDVE